LNRKTDSFAKVSTGNGQIRDGLDRKRTDQRRFIPKTDRSAKFHTEEVSAENGQSRKSLDRKRTDPQWFLSETDKSAEVSAENGQIRKGFDRSTDRSSNV